ncbi:MAG: amidohydrolase family protein [Acidimicrobiia bacterium]
MVVSDRVMRHLHKASGGKPHDEAAHTSATFLPEPDPRPRHYTIISVDDHLIEPAHLFEGRVPAALAERAPHVVTLDDDRETWVYEDGFYPQVGLNAVAGRPKDEWSMEPARFDEMRRGCYDVEARIHDMDLDGVYATLCFPSLIAGFAGTIFANSKDATLGLACLRAWNDWHIDEWAGPHLDRIIPLQLAWLPDPEIAAADVRRNAERGFKAVSFPENPVDLGLPSVHTDHWDPFLRACEETQTVICLHNGSSSWTAARSPGAPLELYTSLFSVNAIAAAADWLWARIPTRFAEIRVAFSEGGIGWVPMLIDRIDYVLDHSAVGSAGWDDPNLAPTDALRRNFWFCTIDIPSTMSLREHIGIDHICLESDYPHADSTWPDTQLRAADGLCDFTPTDVRKVTWENASNLFRHPVPAELQLPAAEKGA